MVKGRKDKRISATYRKRLTLSPLSLLPFPPVRVYSRTVLLKLCPQCRKPFIAENGTCPHCPEPYTWNQESYANVGCLVLMILPLFLLILFWLVLIFGAVFR